MSDKNVIPEILARIPEVDLEWDSVVFNVTSLIFDEMKRQGMDERMLAEKSGIRFGRLRNILACDADFKMRELVAVCHVLGKIPSISLHEKAMRLSDVRDMRQLNLYYEQQRLSTVRERIDHLRKALKVRAICSSYEYTPEEELASLEETVVSGLWDK